MQRNDRAHTQPIQYAAEGGDTYGIGGVSAAFRKLLRRVTTQMTDLARKKSPPKTSFSCFHQQQLLKKRKASISLFKRRRGSHIPAEKQEERHNKTEFVLNMRATQKSGDLLADQTFKSVRCHSNPASGNNSKADIRPKQQYEFLRAKTYNFEEGLAMRPLKNTRALPWFSHTQETPKSSQYQSRIKLGQKKKKSNHIVKKMSKLQTPKPLGAWQPWQSDKHDQFSFLNH